MSIGEKVAWMVEAGGPYRESAIKYVDATTTLIRALDKIMAEAE